MARKGGTSRGKGAALDKGLKTLFRTLEQRPVPDDVKETVDQLEAARAKKDPNEER